jgi:dienelactone hydrolase
MTRKQLYASRSEISSAILAIFLGISPMSPVAAEDVTNAQDQTSPAMDQELVKFDSAGSRPYDYEVRLARERGEPLGIAHGYPIQGYLTKPRGNGPFPAVVLLHSCNGASATRRSVANVVTGWGYVALFVDDYTTRGFTEGCKTRFTEGLSDAFGALLFLSKLPFVDTKRVAVVGFSQGAETALNIASSRLDSAFDVPGDLRFRSAVAFYPPCRGSTGRLSMPTRIFVGDEDNTTPAKDCERFMERQTNSAADIKLIVYPGANHGFDNPSLAGGKQLFGMWLKYDATAAKDSYAQMREFLAAKLGD